MLLEQINEHRDKLMTSWDYKWKLSNKCGQFFIKKPESNEEQQPDPSSLAIKKEKSLIKPVKASEEEILERQRV